MGKASISITIPAPTTPAAIAMEPGLIAMGRQFEEAFTVYYGLNQGSTNGTDPTADSGMIGSTQSQQQPKKRTLSDAARKKIADATRKRHAAARAEKAAIEAKGKKSAGKAMSAGG